MSYNDDHDGDPRDYAREQAEMASAAYEAGVYDAGWAADDDRPLPTLDHEDKRCLVCNRRSGVDLCRGCEQDMADAVREMRR